MFVCQLIMDKWTRQKLILISERLRSGLWVGLGLGYSVHCGSVAEVCAVAEKEREKPRLY